jgi:23S rRNA pseudouridine1911/1915/1917 synthase
MSQMREFEVKNGGQRLDRYLVGRLTDTSRAQVQAWIRQGEVLLNGRTAKASARLSAGDQVRVALPERESQALEPWDFPLTIVYEDAECAVIDKGPDMVVHPASSYRGKTLVHALLFRYPELGEMVDPESAEGKRPGIVHRLDRDTSGLMVVARNRKARVLLQRQFKDRSVEKAYLALVYGRLDPPRGVIEAPIGRDLRNRQRMSVVPEGRPSVTRYRTRQFLFNPHGAREPYTLAEVWPATGRTHQIRVHLAHIGHPVVGDRLYGGGRGGGRRRGQGIACPRQFLHACRLGFHRPSDGRWMIFESALPVDLERVLEPLAAVV